MSTIASPRKVMTVDNFFDFGGNLIIRARVDRLVSSLGLDEVETLTRVLLFERAGDENGNTYVGVIGYEHKEPERKFDPLVKDRPLGVMKGDANSHLGNYLKDWEMSEHPVWMEHRAAVAVQVSNGRGCEIQFDSPQLLTHYARMHGAIGTLLRHDIGFEHSWMVCWTYYHLGRFLSSRSRVGGHDANAKILDCSPARRELADLIRG